MSANTAGIAGVWYVKLWSRYVLGMLAWVIREKQVGRARWVAVDCRAFGFCA